jgi:hypothetical protein
VIKTHVNSEKAVKFYHAGNCNMLIPCAILIKLKPHKLAILFAKEAYIHTFNKLAKIVQETLALSLELVGESFCKAVVEYFSQRSRGGTATLQDIRLILVDDNAANTTRHSFVLYAERSGWLDCSRRPSTGSAASSASSGGSMPIGSSKPMAIRSRVEWSE